MKKINLPLLAVLALFASLMFASCKKDYTCACTVNAIVFDTTINVAIEKQTKKHAKNMCENSQSTIKTYTAALISGLMSGIEDSLTGGIPITITPELIPVTCALK